MNNLKIFNYENNEIRTVQKDNELWWVLKDVCTALELSDTNKVAERLDSDELTRIKFVSGGQNREMYFINESGLYNVILRSDKSEAKKFKRWVTHEVLPTIRKTGGYVADENAFINTYLPYADEQTRNMFAATLQTVRNLNAKIEQDKPKVLFANSVEASETTILIGDLAKLIKQNGVDIGQKRLFEWLRQNGYLIKQYGTSHNMPTQRAMEQGLFGVKETAITHSDGHISISKTVKVTGKGQTFFVNKFLGQR